MPTDSKRKRKERRMRRTISLYEQRDRANLQSAQIGSQLQHAQAEAYAVRVALYSILAQKGGEAEVTVGTMKQVLQTMGRLSINQEEKKGEPGTLIIRLVEAEEPKVEVVNTQEESHEPTESDVPGSSEVSSEESAAS